ncbi:MAG TPA: CmcI family methyltransferase [Polyangia bacterium]|nr:CmcI family methyltransferase [Polyangia bacterium]
MRALNVEWIRRAAEHEHLFRQEWLGERFFHLAADMVALQQLFWQVKPRTVVMTGIAAAGGPIFAASMLQLAGHEAHEQSAGRVIAVDPALRESTRATLATHPLGRRVTIVEGNPVDDAVFRTVAAAATGESRAPVFVILDLIHTHAHVLAELRRYADLVTPGSYVVVLDTIMEELPDDFFAGKPYGKGNNPATAVREFLRTDDRFEVDRDIEDRALITLAPGGFLRRRAR